MADDLYQKGIKKIQELTASPDDNPTGAMDIGAAFKDIAQTSANMWLSSLLVKFTRAQDWITSKRY